MKPGRNLNTEKNHIIIRGCGAISPLGHDAATSDSSFLSGSTVFRTINHQEQPTPVAAISAEAEKLLNNLQQSDPHYKQLDRSVLLAIYAARQAVEQAGWTATDAAPDEELAVNIGSSRGATGLFEQYFEAYKQRTDGRTTSGASPTTTLGNISSWAAHAVNAEGAQISHSITCSTALMAVANGVAWLKAGMAKRFLAGGAEAPLTPFTIAQMKAIGIYSGLPHTSYPCQPHARQRQNTFVLGEGAAVLALECVQQAQLAPGKVVVEAVGIGFEKIESKTGISREGRNFQKAMRHALAQLDGSDSNIDLIITHTPGTYAGDNAERAAIEAVFGQHTPAITTNKWLLGHTLGASGALSLAYALQALELQYYPPLPYANTLSGTPPPAIRRVLINAAGFGGNAATVILKRQE